ncbi:MAG: hypothetical protein RLZZ306_3652, partial [Bacteroidota bacterium]
MLIFTFPKQLYFSGRSYNTSPKQATPPQTHS